MLKNVFQKQKLDQRVKCIKCKQKDATKEDNVCDSCRYLIAIENILESRK